MLKIEEKGHDYFLQVTDARPDTGGLSGASPSEAVSWGKIDPDRLQQFGLVAEEVEKINPDLVARDTKGKAYTVRYDQVDAMLLNEFLKEHRKVANQQKEIDALKAELKEQKSLIQKVSAQFDAIRSAAQLASNEAR